MLRRVIRLGYCCPTCPTCPTCLTTQQAPPPLLPLAGARGRGMRVVSAQLQLSTRTGPQSHATTSRAIRSHPLPSGGSREENPTVWRRVATCLTCPTCLTSQQAPPPLLPLAGADSTLSKEFLMRQNTAVCSGYRSINFSCAHVSRQDVFFLDSRKQLAVLNSALNHCFWCSEFDRRTPVKRRHRPNEPVC